jgi:hypothetical protein
MWPRGGEALGAVRVLVSERLVTTGARVERQQLLPRPDATGEELFQFGVLYSTGRDGVAIDYVLAHMLFNLAVMRGSAESKLLRRELSELMDPADVAKAQRGARDWLNAA